MLEKADHLTSGATDKKENKMIPLETYCNKCDHPYTMTDQHKDCPYCHKKLLEHKMFWLTIALVGVISLIAYLS